METVVAEESRLSNQTDSHLAANIDLDFFLQSPQFPFLYKIRVMIISTSDGC